MEIRIDCMWNGSEDSLYCDHSRYRCQPLHLWIGEERSDRVDHQIEWIHDLIITGHEEQIGIGTQYRREQSVGLIIDCESNGLES